MSEQDQEIEALWKYIDHLRRDPNETEQMRLVAVALAKTYRNQFLTISGWAAGARGIIAALLAGKAVGQYRLKVAAAAYDEVTKPGGPSVDIPELRDAMAELDELLKGATGG